MTKSLLELRNRMKKKKPSFVVKESKKFARVKSRWRVPRGRHSGMRQGHRGKPVLVSTGYGSPKDVKGLHSSGLRKVIINNIPQLEAINPSEEGAVIASSVGNKKRIELLKLAQKKNLSVLNIKDVAKTITALEEKFTKRKEVQKKKLQVRSKRKEEKKQQDKKEENKSSEAAPKAASKETSTENKKFQEEEQRKTIEKTITKKQ